MTATHPVRPWYTCSGNPCTCIKPGGMDRIARIEAAPPAPESFDAVAAVRRVAALADGYRVMAECLHDVVQADVFSTVADDLRRAIAGPS